ncbi:low molecular weight phosphotyrosine protein phosphatase [Siminovitchia acidinfaciens]|uniref:protein-tyrosine-phosphatase n=1 Tax=Siminovitchia acidinfaciens TaxID=2321395 RepID=A0A429Y4J0_9BACI|nr:low molecular weight protein-tyrosine-phosphatase [Siminovitchia acidinfaciens]RST76320.1 low molecular weight phosphotyrosine protein phosphatase [Siminovitchia acidinfaciens]
MTSVLFVCLGNICRSPMAEAIFRDLVRREGLESKIHIDSAGIREWHSGSPPHQGTQEVLAKHGISYDGIYGRQVTKGDLEKFDLIIVMDNKNLSSIRQLAEKKETHAYLLTDFILGTEYTEVPDPFHTGEFDKAYQLIEKGCQGLLETVCPKEKH